MTMLSFRISDVEAADVARRAQQLGIDRSELLRDAIHRYLVHLAGEADSLAWESEPLSDAEQALGAISDWGPAEDWSEWSDAAG